MAMMRGDVQNWIPGALIREREAKGWTREKLAVEADCSLKAISTAESLRADAASPSWDLVCDLADALGICVTRFRDPKGAKTKVSPRDMPRKGVRAHLGQRIYIKGSRGIGLADVHG